MESTPATARLRQLVRLQREELGLSQAEAAERAGMSKSRWRQVEKGGPVPPDRLARMLHVLGITPEKAERLGDNEAAKALRLRRDLLGDTPGWLAGDTEAYLWEAPKASEEERRYLIMTLRVMRAQRELAAQQREQRRQSWRPQNRVAHA